jgi:hypothetical protein
MFHRWAALVLVLALWAMTPKTAAGQGTSKSPEGTVRGSIGNAYPNPNNPDFHIPFTVGDASCTDVGVHEVSIQIKNVLAQLVAIPVLEDAKLTVSSTSSSLTGSQAPVSKLRLGCGHYSAYWNGNVLSGKEAASGVYWVIFMIDGKFAGNTKVFNRK